MAKANSSGQDSCPVCDSESIEADVYGLNGLCLDCGFVLQADTDAIPEWAIPDGDTDSGSSEDWETFCRVQNSTEQQLAEAFSTIEMIADRFELPTDVRAKAASNYGCAFSAGETDGRDTGSMVAACLRLASREVTKPIPTGRLAELGVVDASKFRQSCSVLQSAVEITAPPVEPASYLWFLQQELTIDSQTVERTTDLLERVSSVDTLVGKDPAGIAAGGVYCTSDLFTQQTVADAVGVSSETIRLRVSDLQEATA
jgi:transcription initiation factor TFIIB